LHLVGHQLRINCSILGRYLVWQEYLEMLSYEMVRLLIIADDFVVEC